MEPSFYASYARHLCPVVGGDPASALIASRPVTEITVPLLRVRRDAAVVAQKVQHVLPAPVLLVQGINRLSEGATGWRWVLAAAEVLTSLLVIVAFARAARRSFASDTPEHKIAGIDWVDIFLGAMLSVGVVVHYQETGRIQRPTVLLAAVMFFAGFAHGWIFSRAARRRLLRIDDHGVTAGGRFSQFKAAWPEIAEIAIGPGEAHIIKRDGSERRFNFRHLAGAAAVREALMAAEVRRQEFQRESS